jgi:YHS domain-containing protein
MRNLLIGLVIVLLVVGGLWYFMGRPSQKDSMQEMKMERMDSEAGKKLVECPVMGMKIDPEKAYGKTEYEGKTYYFCCAACPELFKKDPEKYIKK